MTLYVDETYYKGDYKGKLIPDSEIVDKLRLAQEKIDSITHNRIVGIGFSNLTKFQQEKVKDAICSQADYIYEHGYNDENDTDISSYSVLDISVNIDRSSKETTASKIHLSERTYNLIKETGLSNNIL